MNPIPINIRNTSEEVVARIVKSTASKYGCDMDIDFSEGRRDVRFVGDDAIKQHVLEEVATFFDR